MTSTLRVLHLLDLLRESGTGAVSATVDLACCQQALGAEVAVASSGGPLERLLLGAGVRHHLLPTDTLPRHLRQAGTGLHAVLRETRPDIVHAHAVAPALLAVAARFGNWFRLVTTVHSELPWRAGLMAVGERVIAVSHAGAVALLRRGVPAAKLRIVRHAPLGSPRWGAAGPNAGATSLSRPAIVAIGEFRDHSGLDVLIRAFHVIAADVPMARLYLVGEGPERAACEALAASGSGADRIHIDHFDSALPDYLLGADIFVQPALRDPPLLALAEARAAGLAIIASDVGGAPEMLDHGQAGQLVPPGDVFGLARALRELLLDHDSLAEWRARASAETDWLRVERMGRELLTVYREMVDAAATAPFTPAPWRLS